MRAERLIGCLVCAALFVLRVTAAGAEDNVLANHGFEEGLTGPGAEGWSWFGDVLTVEEDPPGWIAFAGTRLVILHGNYTGGYNESAIYQAFDTHEGDVWRLTMTSRHWSGDPLTGNGAPEDNSVVYRIVFKNAAEIEVGSTENVLLDGTFPPDDWYILYPIRGVAPAGAAKVEAQIVFRQPGTGGGTACVDDVVLYREAVPTAVVTWGRVKSAYTR